MPRPPLGPLSFQIAKVVMVYVPTYKPTNDFLATMINVIKVNCLKVALFIALVLNY